jgi:hypothetical protein
MLLVLAVNIKLMIGIDENTSLHQNGIPVVKSFTIQASVEV